MAVSNRKRIGKIMAALLSGAAAYVYVVATPVVVHAQTATPAAKVKVPEGSKLVLSSNELIYNKDSQIVTANGAVQINYGGYRMVSQQVQYNQKTGRMMATGNVELITPDGNRMYGDHMDVTDNFSDGFVDALRVEMPDNTRMAAVKGERVGGSQMILTKGVYTACLPCTSVGRAPIWQVKAQRVVQDGKTHTITLRHARMELFGQPIAYVPWMQVPDNTVKRKSGFLFPTFGLNQNLGFSASVPYYYVISPSADATVTGTYYTSQGFMLKGEVRQRFENGTATVNFAGIDQANPEQFDANTTDSKHKARGFIASKGDFKINPRWAFGWDVMAQTDNDFARTYGLQGYNQSTHTNQVYLEGVGKRNYFGAHAYYFDVQNADTDNDLSAITAEKQQSIVYPVIDYHYVAPEAVAGGELSATVNFTNLTRDTASTLPYASLFDFNNRFTGLAGTDTRLTAEVQWQKTFTTDAGLQLTPLLAMRGDAYGLSMDSPSSTGLTYDGNFDDSSTATRDMLTAGLEAKYPILISTANSTHVITPIAQIYARPNEQLAGELPNEDAQSFVFDATNLFDRDKFSGFDRVEGGTRANVGFRYTGSFDSGYKLQSIFGQSYQLAGLNSFSTDDLVGAGAESGLEDSVSDYVGMFGVTTPQGISLSTSYRLDHNDLSYKRGDTAVSYSNPDFSSSVVYTHIAAQPDYGFTENQDEIQTSAKYKFKDYWSIFGTVSYDLNNDQVTRRGIGLSYEDECTIFTLAYLEHADSSNESASDWAIGAKITFRTLGDLNLGSTEDTTF